MRLFACLPILAAAAAMTSSAAAQSPPPGYYPAPYPPPAYAMRPGVDPFATEPRSRGMMIAGITLFSVGGVTSTVGTAIFFASIANPCVEYATAAPGGAIEARRAGRERTGSARQALSSCDSGADVGAVIVGVGAAIAMVGVPIFVVGVQPVRARHTASLMPQLRLGGTRADLRWSF